MYFIISNYKLKKNDKALNTDHKKSNCMPLSWQIFIIHQLN